MLRAGRVYRWTVPKRSNDYQRVLYFIHRNLSPNLRVTESAMLTDGRTGKPREVDVLVEGEVAGYPIAIAIEVRDHKRPATVEWIEQVWGKYEALPVDKVVVVARAGFWSTALTKARGLGIEALTPTQDVSDSGPLAALKVEVSKLSYDWRRMAEGSAWIDGLAEPVTVVAETALFTPEGVEAMSLGRFTIDGLLHQFQEDQFRPGDAGVFKLAATFENLHMHTSEGEEIEPKIRTEADGRLRHIDRIQVIWEAELTVEPVKLEHGWLRQTPFAFGKVTLPDREALVIINPAVEADPDESDA